MLESFLQLVEETKEVFTQSRTHVRAARLTVASVLTVGRRWITRMISTVGCEQQDWSADYRLFSRSPWQTARLFLVVIRLALAVVPGGKRIVVAMDDTGVSRSGRKVAAARWMRDPLSPKFHLNLKRGIRFLHFSILLRPKGAKGYCRGIPISFGMVTIPKKPKKNAPPELIAAYKEARKTQNLSCHAASAIRLIRQLLDLAGAKDKELLVVADGSFCNRRVLGQIYDRTRLLVRARKDAVLCFPARDPKSRRTYGTKTFTPLEIRKNKAHPRCQTKVAQGSRINKVRYKDVKNVLWEGGTKRMPTRVIVIDPTPYRVSKNARVFYRRPAYLMTTDLETPAPELIQAYFDRWEIEVNHRDLKSTMGLGEAQVWSTASVPRQPAFVVAAYSLLLLAGLKAYGPDRTDAYPALPKWRRKATRPSCLDLVTQLRREALEKKHLLAKLGIVLEKNAMPLKAAG